ncbi:MAG: imidazole glycerol phosphate synthase subunit HisH [Rhodobacter sp.]|nr:imidazole glycerol phosphate synthase subunit HisH [Rhodobacter sp.]MCY4167508.1 imidazole glycerol phosphate synthase subunit HisH [Rhodobacter sp.]MCY4240742.1 imidazole glycerol phosphate synthase subunit HisH [Rhodobacter sp.]
MVTAIIDYGIGNLHSAVKAFQRVSRERNAGEVSVTSDPEAVARADRIVLPGDGAFPACRGSLFAIDGLQEAVRETVIERGRPLLGICVGMQLLATRGHEFETVSGLDWIAGDVEPIRPREVGMKVPHMGWNEMVIDGSHPVLEGLITGDHAYFVHSYHFRVVDDAHRLAYCDYGGDITAIVGRESIVGTQFHPEKSQAAGLRLIANFMTWTP